MGKPNLFIIEGFDRAGKDTILKNILMEQYPELLVYIQNNTPPDYRNIEEFRVWLVNFYKTQADYLVSLNTNVIMARLFVSDYVYSTLFSRKFSATLDEPRLLKKFNVFQYIILFKTYADYLERCLSCNSKVEYSVQEFDIINNLYKHNIYNGIFETKILYTDSNPYDIIHQDVKDKINVVR